jgi:ribosomal protein S18 acetylase RimI-like enzyme
MRELNCTNQVPGVDEFIELRVNAGLSENSRIAAAKGLQGTCFSVCVRDAERLVGMGRVIGDGGCFCQIVDIAVHPDYQRRGIGFQVMTQLMGQLRENAPKSAYISLIADGDASMLYEKFGFEITAPASVGMALRL